MATTVSGGDKLAKRLAQLAAQVKKTGTLNVGFPEHATYPDGTRVALVATIQEFGAPAAGIPPRPFFRGMVARESGHWGDDLAALLKHNGMDGPAALEAIGQEIEEELKMSIRDLISPPLKEATIARKGNPKPLIDTGHMLNSVTHWVKK
jgi:hypothetical protein